MLIRFLFENFLSFPAETEFSMVAGPYKRHPDHTVELEGHAILKGAFLFGANAGGKSNFVRALDFSRQIVMQGMDGVSCDRKYFRLAKDGQHKAEGSFHYDFFANNTLYSYRLVVSYERVCVVGECLMIHTGKEESRCVFSCEERENGGYSVETDFALETEDKARFEVYREDAVVMRGRKRTFLAEIAERAVGKRAGTFFGHFRNAFRWFQGMVVLFPDTPFVEGFLDHLTRNGLKNLGTKLHVFDTGIDSLKEESVEIDKFFDALPLEMRESMRKRMFRDLSDGKGKSVGVFNDDRESYLVFVENGQLVVRKVVAYHGASANDAFGRADESDGTRRLYDLLPLDEAFSRDRVVVIDEIDRSLHTMATLRFIRMFYESAAGKRSQLIATTHDQNVLDLDLLRQDEIWFVEREKGHCSCMYPLTKFKARFDKDVRKDYLLGRYGALPIFGADLEGGAD